MLGRRQRSLVDDTDSSFAAHAIGDETSTVAFNAHPACRAARR